jgi:hypothetical protein
MLCREVVRERGVHNLKADDLIAEITSKGRGMQFTVFNVDTECSAELPSLLLTKLLLQIAISLKGKVFLASLRSSVIGHGHKLFCKKYKNKTNMNAIMPLEKTVFF